MKPTWEGSGSHYISAPFLWEDSLKGHVVVLRRKAMADAHCTLSVYVSGALLAAVKIRWNPAVVT